MTEHKCFVFTFANVEVREREFSILKAGELLPVEPKVFLSCSSCFAIPID